MANNLIAIVSYILISAGFMFMLFGIIGIFTFKNFYPRLLASSKVDTVGIMTLILGMMLRHGFSFFSGKLLILLAIIMIINPLEAYILGHSAHARGHTLDGQSSGKKADEAKK